MIAKRGVEHGADRRGGRSQRLLVLGLSHRTARVEQREKAWLAEPAARSVLRELRRHPAITETAVLSTCNRTELFAVVNERRAGERALRRALIGHSRIGRNELAEASYVYTRHSAARHMFRVAASLDSMVLGESEIQGQVRAARELARQEGTSGAVLDEAFAQALRGSTRALEHAGGRGRRVGVIRRGRSRPHGA